MVNGFNNMLQLIDIVKNKDWKYEKNTKVNMEFVNLIREYLVSNYYFFVTATCSL